MRRVVVLLVCLLALSCGKDEPVGRIGPIEPVFPGMIGLWEGELEGAFEEPFQLRLMIDSTWGDSVFSGAVWSYHPGWMREFTGLLAGSFHFPDTVDVEITLSGFRPFYLRGRFPSYNLITGGAWESGFTGEEWFLNRDLTVRKDVQAYFLTSPWDTGVRNWAESPRKGP